MWSLALVLAVATLCVTGQNAAQATWRDRAWSAYSRQGRAFGAADTGRRDAGAVAGVAAGLAMVGAPISVTGALAGYGATRAYSAVRRRYDGNYARAKLDEASRGVEQQQAALAQMRSQGLDGTADYQRRQRLFNSDSRILQQRQSQYDRRFGGRQQQQQQGGNAYQQPQGGDQQQPPQGADAYQQQQPQQQPQQQYAQPQAGGSGDDQYVGTPCSGSDGTSGVCGLRGTCQGTSVRGLCPGSWRVQCCMSSAGAAPQQQGGDAYQQPQQPQQPQRKTWRRAPRSLPQPQQQQPEPQPQPQQPQPQQPQPQRHQPHAAAPARPAQPQSSQLSMWARGWNGVTGYFKRAHDRGVSILNNPDQLNQPAKPAQPNRCDVGGDGQCMAKMDCQDAGGISLPGCHGWGVTCCVKR